MKELFRNEKSSELLSQRTENENDEFPESIKLESLKPYRKGTGRPIQKIKKEELTNSSVQKPSSPKSTRVPWWASFSKKSNNKAQTTTVKETTTEANQPISSNTVSSEITVSTTRTNMPDSNHIQYGYSKVFKDEKSTNIIGKLLNVTGRNKGLKIVIFY